MRRYIKCGFLILIDGSLWGWGKNEYGELGLGHSDPVSTPTKMALSNIKNLQTGANHVVAICSKIF